MAGRRAGQDLGYELAALGAAGRVGDLPDGPLLRRAVEGDEVTADAAFTALVERHGPMVLRVCRDRLGHAHDAEDAFQATFLVLARRAGSVRRADSVASWLHGVAHKVATRARGVAARRDAVERQAAALRPEHANAPAAADMDLDLHAALERLPAKLRDPLILCYFEGLTTDEAAGRLGCPRGTVLSRLARGRDRLRATLTRAVPVPVAGPALDAWLAATPARIPPLLAEATARASSRILAGAVPARLVAAPVAALTEGVLRMMFWTKLKSLGLIAAALMTLAVGARAGLAPLGPEPPAPVPVHQTPPDPAPAPAPTRTAIVVPLPHRDELHQLLRRAAAEVIELSRTEPGAVAWTLTPIAAAQARAGDRDGARASFELAVRDAPAGNANHRPAEALWRVGHAQAEVGLGDDARATLRQASAALPERAVVEVMADAKPGVVVNPPPGNQEVLGWFTEITRDQMRLGARADARATADRLDGFARSLLETTKIGNARDFYGPMIAATRAAVGDFDAAFGWLDGINTAGTALGAIALTATQALDRESARRFVAEATTRLAMLGVAPPGRVYQTNLGLRNLAEAQARIGEIEAARRSVAAIGVGPNRDRFDMTPDRAAVLLRIAQIQREAGDLPGARATLLDAFRMIDEHQPWRGRDGSYQEIIDAQLGVGDIPGALRSLGSMASPQPEQFAWIARALAAAGQDAAAAATSQRAIVEATRAVELARADPEGAPEAGASGFISLQVDAVDMAAPVASVDAPLPIQEIPADPSHKATKSSTRFALAQVQAMAGDVPAAIEARRAIGDTYLRYYALNQVIVARATAGDVAGAFRLALEEAKSPGDRRFALQGLAEGVTARLTTPGLEPKPAP